MPANSEVASHLRIEKCEETVRIRRLRLSSDTPAALDTAYLPCPLCEPLLDIDLERQSLYPSLKMQLPSNWPTSTGRSGPSSGRTMISRCSG